ncbi:FAD-binding oxidoreductase [Gordonia neofelifaecis]|uniref:Putative oxidoreductase n=1 Tax=Gordonia neofelifaecis NRRL B-59395 TaxID=644548 RepID=F1YGF5_9ACTN|nr:FAD-binding oxidoreductase [Gordonia neofelifaecis]EGD56102.1 putative oxidoreductase [Gordonia neofelifaecis NRRL B-59395]
MTIIDPTEFRGAGPIHFPGDPDYDRAATPWNCAIVQTPVAVATPRSVEEVIDVVRAAVAAGLRIAPQSTGHGSDAVVGSDMDRAILLRMSEFSGVTIDPDLGTARILGGTLWQAVLDAAAPFGLTALHGSTGDVAVAGFILGGGLSFYGRRHGLATSSVLSIDLVTAGGRLVHASPTSHSDLFWALLGGGGSFGVIVSIEIALLPIADVVAGMLLWDLADAPRVAHAWAQWTRTVPDDSTTTLRMMRFPPLPELPPFLSGRSLVVIDGAVLADDATAADRLAPLRELGPEIDTFGRIPSHQVTAVHMDPPDPTPTTVDHSLLSAFPEDAVDALLDIAGPGVDTPLMFAEIRHLGGALAEPADAALPCLDADYALIAVSAIPVPEAAGPGDAAVHAVVDALASWSTGAFFPNFHGRPEDTAACFDQSSWDRLRRTRQVYDPAGIWVAGHAVK